jgi:hypothetical protein
MTQATQAFQAAIKAHFDALAAQDELFNREYTNPDKSLENCCNYILGEVQKSGKCGFSDEEIYGMGLHYYSEAELTEVEPINQGFRIVTNQHDSAPRTQAAPTPRTDPTPKMPKLRKKAAAQMPSLFDEPQPSLFD